MSGQRWVTVKQVADELHVAEETVREWLRAGKLRGHLINRRAGWRVRAEDLEAFMEGGTDADDGRLRDPE